MLTLIRHGESMANATGTLSGWQNVSLTLKGRSQAKAAGRQLQGLSCSEVWCSDLIRARETAEIAMNIWKADRTPMPPMYVRAALRERCMGELQGLSKSVLRRHNRLDVLKTWSKAPKLGESLQQLSQRVFPCLEQIPSTSFVFAHGGVIRMILGVSQSVPPEEWMYWKIPNATPIAVKIPEEGWKNRVMQLML